MVSKDSSHLGPDDAGVDYRIAAEYDEREEAFRLVYESYLPSGLVRPNPFEMRILPHHLLSSTEIFVAEQAGQILSTVTLVCDGELGLPMESVYPLEVRKLQRQGKRLGEVSCLASRRSTPIAQCLELLRLMVQTARYRGLDGLAVAVHPRHARFYNRFLAFEQVGSETLYPAVCDHPAVAMLLDFDRIDRERPGNYERFFGERLPVERLQPRPMDADQWECFHYLFEAMSGEFSFPSRERRIFARGIHGSQWYVELGDVGMAMPLATSTS
jgi:hypothetical protein